MTQLEAAWVEGCLSGAMVNLEVIEDVLLGTNCTLEKICAELATIFGVRTTEIGILRVEGELLRFVFPPELNSAGCIPISGSAIAARTAASKTSVLYNNFANVPHHSVFELIKLKPVGSKNNEEPSRIQKLMSSPILSESAEVLGVVQVSRKGESPGAAGTDFTEQELYALEAIARRVATLKPEILFGDLKKPSWKLELQNDQKKAPKQESKRGRKK